jgi:hypothetical protein
VGQSANGQGFLLGVEAAETADLRQELAEAVAEVHQAGARRAIDQAVNQLHQHQRAEQELGHLPDQGNTSIHRTRRAMDSYLGAAFGSFMARSSVETTGGNKVDIGFRLGTHQQLDHLVQVRPSNRIACSPATSGMYTPVS